MTAKQCKIAGLLLLSGVLLTGCCPTHKYKPVEGIPIGKGIIYIYRPSNPLGSALTFNVYSGQNPIVALKNNTYYPYIVKPGERVLWTKYNKTSTVTVGVKEGEEIYVKCGIEHNIIIGGNPKLMVESPDVAKKEIKPCCKRL
jgi:hypothetical protein